MYHGTTLVAPFHRSLNRGFSPGCIEASNPHRSLLLIRQPPALGSKTFSCLAVASQGRMTFRAHQHPRPLDGPIDTSFGRMFIVKKRKTRREGYSRVIISLSITFNLRALMNVDVSVQLVKPRLLAAVRR